MLTKCVILCLVYLLCLSDGYFLEGQKDCGRNRSLPNGNITYPSITSIGSTLTYTCHDGYTLVGTNTSNCGATGSWTGTIPSCIIKDCGRNVSLSNGNVIYSDKTTFNSTLTYTCQDGYALVGPNTSKCDATGSWRTKIQPTCIIKDCGRTVNLANGNVIYSNKTTFNSTLTYTCHEGYTLVGTSTSKCDATGSWTKVIPICNIKDCGGNVILSNGNVIYSDKTTFNSTLTYTCNAGYTLVGPNTSKCEATGSWTKIQPTCNIKDCGRTENLPNGNVIYSDKTTFNSTLTYTCHEGYTLVGPNVTKCSATGSWNKTGTFCNIIDCGRNASLSNGYVTFSDKTTFTSTLTYTCHEGYTLVGPDISKCDSTGSWNKTGTVCNKDCGPVGILDHGSIMYINGSTVTYVSAMASFSCEEGYLLVGDNQSTCQADGNWSAPLRECRIKDCGKRSPPNHGNVSSNKSTFGAEVTFSCNNGYDMIGNNQSRCRADGHWSASVPECQIKDCKSLDPPVDGNILFSDHNNVTTFGAVVRFNCHNGYQMVGENRSQCQSDGHWSVSVPTCERDCGPVGILDHGSITYINGSTVTYVGAIASFSCEEGYLLAGDNQSTCQANGNWSAPLRECRIKGCGKNVTLDNGKVIFPNSITYGSILTYICNDGFSLVNSNTSYCALTGNWNNSGARCRIKDCGRNVTIDNGKVKFLNKTTYGSSLTYSCDDGYKLEGSNTSYCDSTGTWNNTSTSCRIKVCPHPPEAYRATYVLVNNSRNYMSQVVYSCEFGYETQDNRTLTCNASGLWDYSPPNCTDTNECQGNHRCHISAQCFNFPGGYTCECKGGFTDADKDGPGGSDHHCIEKTIVDLTTPVEQKRYDRGQENPESFPDKFPYFGVEYEFYRVNMNGFIALGYKPIDQQHGPTTPELWKHFSMDYPIVAPLWANLDTTNITGAGLSVHHLSKTSTDNHTLTDLAIVKEVFNRYKGYEGFDPTFALVVTWRNATTPAGFNPYIAVQYHNATMQAILATDGLFSYVMFNYDQEQWTLDPKNAGNVSAGYSDTNLKGHILANNDNFTHLANGSNVVPELNGRYIYNLTTVTDLLVNQSLCRKFAANETARELLRENRMKATPCPCQLVIMKLDYTFRDVGFLQNDSLYDHRFSAYCYEEWFFNYQGMRQRCCYGHGALKTNSVDGGFVSFKNNAVDTLNEYYRCCLGDHRLCPLFYDVSPSDDCKRWSPDDEFFGSVGLGDN